MKQRILLPLLCVGLLLSGCGQKHSNAAEIQRQYGLIATAQMEAEIVFHNGGEDRIFTIQCDYTPAESAMVVTGPETVAGVCATLTGEELTLTYDGESLSVGEMAGVNPLSALPQLLHILADGYLVEEGRQTLEYVPCYRLVLDRSIGGETVVATVWIDEETLLPRYAEFAVNGATNVSINMLSFSCTLQEGTTEE